MYNQLESQGKFKEMDHEINRLRRSEYYRNISSNPMNATNTAAINTGSGTGNLINTSDHLASDAILNKAKIKIP